MTFADSKHDKCQRFSVFNLSEFREKPDLCLPSATALPSQRSLKRHLETHYFPPLLRPTLSALQISPFATFHNALQQGTACFSRAGLMPSDVKCCKCDILQTKSERVGGTYVSNGRCHFSASLQSINGWKDCEEAQRSFEIPVTLFIGVNSWPCLTRPAHAKCMRANTQFCLFSKMCFICLFPLYSMEKR